MNKLKNAIALFALLAALPLAAQTNLHQTTLTASVSASASYVTVASATGISAPGAPGGNVMGAPVGSELYVDGEAMLVTSVSGTTIGVVRGAAGMGAAHQSGSVVWVGTPNQFYTVAPPAGSCTAAASVNPYINAITGQLFLCDTATGNWQPLFSTGSITPAATSAAIQTVAQTFTVTGLMPGEPVVVAYQPAPTSLCPLTAARVTAANTVSLYYTVLTASACTPAPGTYMFLAPRVNIP